MEALARHCLHHNFLAGGSTGFVLLGQLLCRRIEEQWSMNAVSSDISLFPTGKDSLSLGLLSELVSAHALSGMERPIAFSSSRKVACSSKESQTVLDLKVFSPPSRKIDDFTSLQKKRRQWWKSLLQQPEHLVIQNISPENLEPHLEQCIEYCSEDSSLGSLEVLKLWKPDIFEDLVTSEELREQLLVKFQGKPTWPSLMTSEVRLDSAVWFFLADAFSHESVLSLHHSLAPFSVAILIESADPAKLKELEDLRRLLSLQLSSRSRGGRVPVLPPGSRWDLAQCDARGIPYLILLDDSTLDQGICSLRNRDTAIKEQVHVSDIVQRLKNVLTSE